VQRAPRTLLLSLAIELVGDGHRLGVQFDDAPQRRALAIELLDASRVLLDERSRGIHTALHALLKIGDGRLFEIENRGGGGPRLRRHSATARHGRGQQASGHRRTQ
jgi:hypothetical protein